MSASPIDPSRAWRLQEVADAAWEIPVDQQPPRLRDALARLVELPEPEDQLHPDGAAGDASADEPQIG